MRPIVYDTYFWQDGVVRLRAVGSGDGVHHLYNRYDSPARLLLDAMIELPPTEAEISEFEATWANFGHVDERIMFSIETLAGEYVGGLNINSIDERNGTFGIGIQIDRDHRGKGYGTAAMRILLQYAFFERRLHKFNVSVLEGNVASARMLEKLGCVREGVRREVVFANGRYLDEILYGMTEAEFRRTLERGADEAGNRV
jgi:RimJ/RimL family protein N-acetyltransferase